MKENRKLDQIIKMYPAKGVKKQPVSKDLIKSAFIADGLGAKEISRKFGLSIDYVENYIREESWEELRKAYIIQGINKIQNVQVDQAQKLLNLETNFKALRLAQLQEMLEEYAAYYARFGDLKKRNPVTGEVLKNDNGIAMTIKIPQVAKEIRELKESVTVSDGMRSVIRNLESLVSAGDTIDTDEVPDTININDYEELFSRED